MSKLASQIERVDIIHEMRVQEAVGTMKRFKVEVYHDHMMSGERTIFATARVWAPSEGSACEYISNRYGVHMMYATGIKADQYQGGPIPYYVVTSEKPLSTKAPGVGHENYPPRFNMKGEAIPAVPKFKNWLGG